MVTFPYYHGETYQAALLVHDELGAVISDAFTDVELFVKFPDSPIAIPATPLTVLYKGQSVTVFSFVLADAHLSTAPLGIHYAQLWGNAGLGAKMITADVALHIKEGRT